jgi:hypothetical protein
MSSKLGLATSALVRAAIVASVSFVAVGGALANVLTYTETAAISGSLNGQSFSGDVITLTGTGDRPTSPSQTMLSRIYLASHSVSLVWEVELSRIRLRLLPTNSNTLPDSEIML